MVDGKVSQVNELVFNLESFISKENYMIRMSKEIEAMLDEIYPDEDIIQDYIGDLAMYSPNGGDHLYDFDEILPKVKLMLNWVNQHKIA